MRTGTTSHGFRRGNYGILSLVVLAPCTLPHITIWVHFTLVTARRMMHRTSSSSMSQRCRRAALIFLCLTASVASTNPIVSSFATVPTESPSNDAPVPTTAAPTPKHNATAAPMAGPTTSPTTSRPPHLTLAPVVPAPVEAPVEVPVPLEVPVPVITPTEPLPVPVETPVAPPVPVATPIEPPAVPMDTPFAPPLPIAPPVASPVAPPVPAPHAHVSIVRILAKTVAWLILILLSVVAFGAAMSHRYRIYYFLRTAYYTALGWPCSRWLRSKIASLWGGGGGSSSYSSMDVNTIIFDNDMNEGLLMRESEYD